MENFRIDETGFGDIKIIQDIDGFCYGVDAVILADFAAKNQKNVNLICDLGTGNGIIPLLLSYLTNANKIIGIDKQESAINLAKQSCTMNNLEERLSFICSDIKGLEIGTLIENDKKLIDVKLERGFDMLVCNPPYFSKGSALVNPDDALATARHETTATLKDFFATAKRFLKYKGRLYMINRPSRLPDAIAIGRSQGMEPRKLRMVTSKIQSEPKMVLMEFVKDGGREFLVENNLVIYNDSGEYTDEIERIYHRK